jgi:uncharacterized tellurite resistance protein B-like protein
MSASTLNHEQRIQIVHLACIAAWSNLDVRDEERDVVLDMARQLGLSDTEMARVKGWLQDGPPDFDPYTIPREHREAYLRAFLEVVTADGRIDLEESETIRVLRELLA